MRTIKAAMRAIIGLVFGIIAYIALLPAFAAFTGEEEMITPIIAVLLIVGVGFLGFFTPTIRRAFGRGFLIVGVSLFALPISTFLLSGRVAHDTMQAAAESDQAATAVGAGIAGVALTGAATFLGLIGGLIFVVLGLVLSLGGRREVIVVKDA